MVNASRIARLAILLSKEYVDNVTVSVFRALEQA